MSIFFKKIEEWQEEKDRNLDKRPGDRYVLGSFVPYLGGQAERHICEKFQEFMNLKSINIIPMFRAMDLSAAGCAEAPYSRAKWVCRYVFQNEEVFSLLERFVIPSGQYKNIAVVLATLSQFPPGQVRLALVGSTFGSGSGT